MRFLFFASHPGHIRNFESAVGALADRGHEVHLAFDRLKTNLGAQEDLITALVEEHPTVSFGDAPKRKKTPAVQSARQLRIAVDYLRFLSPEFSRSDRLRERMASRTPRTIVELAQRDRFSTPKGRASLDSALRTLERSMPTPESVVEYVREQRPDAVLVTPLLEIGTPQLDYLRAARILGIPTALLVASWDNLTTKGVIQELPDLVTVWNQPQLGEAVELHGVPADRVAVTGANAYDHWFEWAPSTTHADFCRGRGLDPDRPFILYLGSSGFIARNEAPFILDWVRRLRREGGPLADAGVLVRPHPTNPLAGKTAEQRELAAMDRVAVWPPAGSNPTDREKRSAYYDSIFHSGAVVGINTSALIESAIVGRQVLTLLAPAYEQSQEGSLHFHHLVRAGGGMLRVARTFEEHERQLQEALSSTEQVDRSSRKFLEEFVRPYALDEPATPRLVAAIEGLEAVTPEPVELQPKGVAALRATVTALSRGGLLDERGESSAPEPRDEVGDGDRRPRRLVHRIARGRAGAPLPERARFASRAVIRKALATAPLRAQAYRMSPRLPETAEPESSNGAQSRLREILVAEIERAARHEHKLRFGKNGAAAAGKPGRRLRILFSMAYPGYLRYYDDTVRELANRGHEVELCFSVEHKQAEGYDALPQLKRANKRITTGRLPKIRRERWKPVATGTRVAMDYLRYLDPRFGQARYLRDRVGERLPPRLGFLRTWDALEARWADRVPRIAQLLEDAIPTNPEFDEYIAERKPDVVVVTPLVTVGSIQNDLVKSANAAGAPVVLGVASWDHLTTKGLVRVPVDRAIVWNEQQMDEAERLHRLPRQRLVMTGAQPFDRWFERQARPREVICGKAGLPTDKPYLLFLGSTQSISRPEAERGFVLKWIEALRESADPALREVAVMIRPHPYNAELWSGTEISGLGDVGIWPRIGANPVLDEDRADYYDSLYHAAAVVGINTSAMIEAAIAGTPVFTIRAPEFVDTQTGTVHFGYLLHENGGPAKAADSFGEHLQQILDSEVLSGNGASREALERFVDSFVRPRGVEHPSVPLVADAIEQAAGHRAREAPSVWAWPLRGGLWALGTVLLLSDRERLSASLEMEHLVGRTSRALAPLVKRASRSMEPGRTPVGEYLRVRRPEVVAWLDEAARKPEMIGKGYLKRWVEHERSAAG